MNLQKLSLVFVFVACAGPIVGSTLAAEPAENPKAPAKDTAKPGQNTTSVGEVYPLATCPISGKKLGAMGDPIVKTYEGREVRFCCGGCPPKFEKELTKSLTSLDQKIIADQAPIYPLTTSVVSTKKLPEKPVDWVYKNRLIRLADEAEKAEFQKDPAKYLVALDKAVVDAQGKDYPLTTCPVSKDKLEAMGEGRNVVIGGRLIRLCCASCEDDVKKSPATFISTIDDARKNKKQQ